MVETHTMSDQVHYKTACGSCQGRIEFPAAAAGATIRCPHCGASTVLNAPGGAPPAPAPAPVAAPAATTKGACQHCSGNIAFPAAAAGSTVNCPHCGKPTKLGASGGAVQEGIEAALSEISAKEKLKPKKKPVAPGSGGGKGKLLAIVGVVVVLLAGLGVGAMLMLKKKAPEGPKKPEKDLEVLTHQLQKAKEGGLVYVIGTVTNHSEQQYFSLKIEFELSDKDGKSLGMVSDYVGNLGAHKVWDFKALVLEDSTAQAKLMKLEGEPESAPAPATPKVEEPAK
jgi:predicted RNA-binding Zn-ribbon protein involved in translation (DUF1610 family)/flagellar basal body-associated protein FliL